LRLFSAYETKDEAELAALREVGLLASEVVKRTWQFLAAHKAESLTVGAPLRNQQGQLLTIGMVKQFILQQEVALGLDNPKGPIFAQGRDAGVPHSHGQDDQVVEVGRSIVFDYYPRSSKTGYYHDMTRTWCMGLAPAEVAQAYSDVHALFGQVVANLRVGEPTANAQILCLDFFEARGYETPRSHPGTQQGYVHSVGHGLGLSVHEAPAMRHKSTDLLRAGNVITIEPGLYYPERGFGIRVEDTVYLDADGNTHTLTHFPYDLVLPVAVEPSV
jgi:Xaa-Pro aminopeptidase